MRKTVSAALLSGQLLCDAAAIGGGWEAITSPQEDLSGKIQDGISFPISITQRLIDLLSVGDKLLTQDPDDYMITDILKDTLFVGEYGAGEVITIGQEVYYLQKNISNQILTTILAGLSSAILFLILAQLFSSIRIGDDDSRMQSWRKRIARRIGLKNSQLSTGTVEDIQNVLQDSDLSPKEARELIMQALGR